MCWELARRSPGHPTHVGEKHTVGISSPPLPLAQYSISPGDLVYTRLLNQDVIVINSEDVAKDLLERRSRNYSDRPAIIRIANDL